MSDPLKEARPAPPPSDLAQRVDRACDLFEVAWRAGQSPRIENSLADVAPSEYVRFLRELIVTELELRRARGDIPRSGDYTGRFPRHAELIDNLILAPTSPGGDRLTGFDQTDLTLEAPGDDSAMMALLAYRLGLVGREALTASVRNWAEDRSRSLVQVLVDGGSLPADGLDQLINATEVHRGMTPCESEATVSLAAEGLESGPRALSVGQATSMGRRFRILRMHEKGGLGTVFVARDIELNRDVALKEIQPRFADDPQHRARFQFEAEITGGLEHPGIVPVYGLGHDSDGRPYYAMRFIRGDSLKVAIENFHADTSLMDDPGRRSLELRKLLLRFLDVCNAVDYAHSRGVLHRDIKPGNVIVGKYGETLVIDWGLAKPVGRREESPVPDDLLLTPSVSSGSAETLPGSAVGTPAYMSPEQAAGDLDRLGTRSDVYSLGATLYCLLTGKPPIEGHDVTAILRAAQGGDFRAPRLLDPSIDKALESVCCRAMARAPEARYATPQALADDVERWMADEPVTSWKEPAMRRARRWGRQHRTAMTGAIVAMVAGLAGLAAVAAVRTRANNALEAKNLLLTAANAATTRALVETRVAKQATELALAQSEVSRQQAEAVSTFLVDTFRSPDPSQIGRDVKVADVLDRAAERLDKEFSGSEATRGSLLHALARTYRGLGYFDKALTLHAKAGAVREAALGRDHIDTIDSRGNLALALWDAGRMSEALALFEETLKSRQTKQGPDHPDTLKSRSNLAIAFVSVGRTAEAIALHISTLKLREARLGSDHADTLASRNNLALAFMSAGRTQEAIALHQSTLKLCEDRLGTDHPQTLASRNNLANAYYSAGRLPEAIVLYEQTLRQSEARLGPDHPDTIGSYNNLANALRSAGRTSEGIAMLESTLRRREVKLGEDHPDTLTSRNNLANAYQESGRLFEATALHESTLKKREAVLGRGHPDTLASRNNLANTYLAAGRSSEAIALHDSTLRLREAELGHEHPDTLISHTNLAAAYESLGQWNHAENSLRHVLACRRKTDPPESPLLAGDLAALGRNLLLQSRSSEAEPLLRQSLAIREKTSSDDRDRYDTMSLLGTALLGQHRYTEAEPLIVQGYEGLKANNDRTPPPDQVDLGEAAERVIRLYESWGQHDQAMAWKLKLGLVDLPADVFAAP